MDFVTMSWWILELLWSKSLSNMAGGIEFYNWSEKMNSIIKSGYLIISVIHIFFRFVRFWVQFLTALHSIPRIKLLLAIIWCLEMINLHEFQNFQLIVTKFMPQKGEQNASSSSSETSSPRLPILHGILVIIQETGDGLGFRRGISVVSLHKGVRYLCVLCI